MIDIQQHALRAFKQNLCASPAHFLQPLPNRLRKPHHEWRNLFELCQQSRPIHRGLIKACTQGVMVRAKPVQLRLQIIEMRQIAHADCTAPDLVFIGWANTAPGRADLALARRDFAQAIKVAVDRQDQRAIVRNRKIVIINGDALAFQLLDLGLQSPRVEHNAIADHRERARDNARWQQRELVGRAINHQRVASIMPALKAHHSISTAGEPVNDFAFAFIAPLSADYSHIGHGMSFLRLRARKVRTNGAGLGVPKERCKAESATIRDIMRLALLII